ncbi:hypothetical protein BTZ20_5487 [Rhodococcus sp. MTM3W5.2]|nr:hypothetical protein BTZ20_5487 [Rhodococcus sp. MTM3W5.2]
MADQKMSATRIGAAVRTIATSETIAIVLTAVACRLGS